jgi:PleD family two-component response regulator
MATEFRSPSKGSDASLDRAGRLIYTAKSSGRNLVATDHGILP